MPSIPSKLFNIIWILLRYKKRGPKRWAHPKRNRHAFESPWFIRRKFKIEKRLIMGRRIITIQPRKISPNYHLLFFHGGAYADEITILHWWFVGKLVKRSGCKCTLIEYPLTPEHDHRDTFRMVKTAYQKLAETHQEPIILMGDSAGGGLSLALAQLLRVEKIQPQPKKLVLISPWIDIQPNPKLSAEIKQKDLILSPEALEIAGRNYSGPAKPRHYLVSPIYGDFEGLSEVGIWAGTSEIFHPEMARLTEKLEQAGVPFQYFEGQGMQHDYPLFPIPEGREAVREICGFINGKV